MLKKIKADLLHGYTKNIDDLKPSISFIEIDKEKMYDENSDSDVPFKYIQLKDSYIVFAVIPEFMEYAKKYYEIYKNDLFTKKAYDYLFGYISDKMKKYGRRPYLDNKELEKHCNLFRLP